MHLHDWNDLVAHFGPRLASLRVRVYGSGGAPYHHLALAALFGADVGAISADAIRAGGLDDADVLVMPGGGVRAMSGLLEPLGAEGAASIRGFVETGGMYVGSCAGSFLPAAVGASFWNQNPQARYMCMVNARLYNAGDSEWAGLTSPGVGTVHVTTERPRHWLATGLPPHFRLVHYNGPMFTVTAGAPPDPQRVAGTAVANVTGVVRFAAATRDFTPGEAFMAPPPEGPTLFERGAADGAFSAVAGAFGEGTVVLFGSHPEFGLDTVQLGWDDGVRLFGNALAYRAADGRRSRRSPVANQRPQASEAEAASVRSALAEAAALAVANASRFEALAGLDPGDWVTPGAAAGFLGLEPRDLWRQAGHDAAAASAATGTYLRGLANLGTSGPRNAAETWLQTCPPDGQDYGFAGLLPLLRRVAGMADTAREAMTSEPFALGGPYDAMDRHPYQLGLSSYLSAAGLAASGLLCAVTTGRVMGDRSPLPSQHLLASLK